MKRFLLLLLAALMILAVTGCDGDEPVISLPTEPDAPTEITADLGEVTFLFTGGLEGVYARDDVQGAVGYAALAAYADSLCEDGQVILIDGGASVDPQGSDRLWEIVDNCDYDIRVPGATEFASGVENLLDRTHDVKDCVFISCNLMNLSTHSTVFRPYVVIDLGEIKVGFVGVTKPGVLPDMDAQNYSILGLDDKQSLYDAVQRAVDDAEDAGADYVVVVGNLGTAPDDSPCTTVEVISNITGMVAWLDCGSGAVLDGDIVTDKDDFEIPICAPGSAFRYVGQIVLDLNDGTALVNLLTEFVEEDRAVSTLINELQGE